MNPFVWGYTRRARTVLAYVFAVVLPLLAAAMNNRFHILQFIPFALYFVSVAIVASLGGFLPALLDVVLSIAARSHTLATVHNQWKFRFSDIVAAAVMSVCGLLVSLVTESRRQAIEDLQDRTNALIDSLNSGKCASWLIHFDKGGAMRWYSGSYPVFGRPFESPSHSTPGSYDLEHLESLQSLVHPEDQTLFHRHMQSMRTVADPVVFDFRVPWPDGELHWLETRGSRIPGQACVWRGVTMDVTERKLAEAALLRSEKLSAMGRLASTVAHEINNPLESVTNLLYLARTDPKLDETTRSYLTTAEDELARLCHITRLTLGFVRTSESRTELALSEVVDSALSIFRTRYEAKQIDIRRSYQPGVCITAAHHELRQIITNLIANAIDALSSPGAIIAIHISRQQNSAVLLVEDNGSGIDAPHLARIFDPFFTTKKDVGTGIGLWVTRELVEKNGGRITAFSEGLPSGMSTQFRIEFPLA